MSSRGGRRSGLPERLVGERNVALRVIGRGAREALISAVLRWLLEYGALLVALAAVGAEPRPSLVLLGFTAAQLLALIPVTPGGLGFVEAGLTGLLVLAGVSAGDAAVATLAYRLVSYWPPPPAGAVAAVVHRRVLQAQRAGGAALAQRPLLLALVLGGVEHARLLQARTRARRAGCGRPAFGGPDLSGIAGPRTRSGPSNARPR